MQEWRRLDAEGNLVGPKGLFFAKTKPAEELYDTQADPHEVKQWSPTSPSIGRSSKKCGASSMSG